MERVAAEAGVEVLAVAGRRVPLALGRARAGARARPSGRRPRRRPPAGGRELVDEVAEAARRRPRRGRRDRGRAGHRHDQGGERLAAGAAHPRALAAVGGADAAGVPVRGAARGRRRPPRRPGHGHRRRAADRARGRRGPDPRGPGREPEGDDPVRPAGSPRCCWPSATRPSSPSSRGPPGRRRTPPRTWGRAGSCRGAGRAGPRRGPRGSPGPSSRRPPGRRRRRRSAWCRPRPG